MYYLLSLIAGTLLAFMVSSNGIVGEAAGNYASSVIIHFIGLVAVIIILFVQKAKFKNLRSIPLWMYSAGLVGIVTVLFTNLTYTALGVSLTVALGLLGQSVTSILIDHFGLFGLPISRFDTKKILGFVIILSGIIIMAFPS